MSLHDIFHVFLLTLFLGAMGTAFLGILRPFVHSGNLKLPGPKATAGLFFTALMAGAADWILHQSLNG